MVTQQLKLGEDIIHYLLSCAMMVRIFLRRILELSALRLKPPTWQGQFWLLPDVDN